MSTATTAVERLEPDIAPSPASVARGRRTLTVVSAGGQLATLPLAPRVARAIDLAVGGRPQGPIFVEASGVRVERHAAERIMRRIAVPRSPTTRVPERHASGPPPPPQRTAEPSIGGGFGTAS